ncbi:MAG: hypothetical protein H0W72_17965, partial [Planctomycetes bacterium]|nr:hypothetical protein [Planctomycetota bacterium]
MLSFTEGASASLPDLGPLRLAECGEHTVAAGWSTWGRPAYRTPHHSAYHILAGGCSLEFAGRETSLRPGALHIIPGNQLLRRRTEGMRHRWLNFNAESLSVDLQLGRLDRVLSFP